MNYEFYNNKEGDEKIFKKWCRRIREIRGKNEQKIVKAEAEKRRQENMRIYGSNSKEMCIDKIIHEELIKHIFVKDVRIY